MQTCAVDADCRADEGYVCDPQWRACLLPNTAVIVPRVCPAAPGPARDPAFAPSTQLSTATAAGAYQTEPTAALGPDGGLVVLASSRGAPTEPTAIVAARVGGPAPGPAATRLEGAADQQGPRIARDTRGTLYAVALAHDPPATPPRVLLTTSRDGGVTWSSPISVHEPADCPEGEAGCLARPLIAVGPDPARKGQQLVHVMYAARGGLRVRTSRDGGTTFGPAVTALAGSYGNATVGADGSLHLVMSTGAPSAGAFGSANHAIEYAVSTTGGRTFAKPRRLSARDETLPFVFSNPSVAVDPRRRWIYAAYVRGGRDAVWDLVILASKDGGATWTRTRLGDTPACAIHMVPNLALDPTTGTLHVAWYDSRGPHGRFAHATCRPGARACTQVGAINDVPFATLSTVRHAAPWVGEAQALVIDDRRRTLHAVWAQPIDEQGTIVSRIFHAAAKLPRR